MENLLSILLIILTIELLVIGACFVVITYFLAKALRSVSDCARSMGRIKSFLTIPALILAIISRFFKKRG